MNCLLPPTPGQRLAILKATAGPGEESPFDDKRYHNKCWKDYLQQAGVVVHQCLVGHLDSPDLASSLALYKPNIVVLLGRQALQLCGIKHSLDNWRGSLWIQEAGPLAGFKCIATYEPAQLTKQHECVPMVIMDLRRALQESTSPLLSLPQRKLMPCPTYEQALQFLQQVQAEAPNLSCDIEGWVWAVSCISLDAGPLGCLCLPFSKLDSSSYWTEEQEASLLLLLARVMADPLIHKTFQNGLYDRLVLLLALRMPIYGNKNDTMLKFWEKYAELPKRLGFQASVLTREPFYKSERKSADDTAFYTYCCKDSAVTAEISSALDKLLTPAQQSHYSFNLYLLNALLYMQAEGLAFNKELQQQRKEECEQFYYALQTQLDQLCGKGLLTEDRTVLVALTKGVLCMKRNPEQPKKGNKASFDWAMRVLHGPCPLSEVEKGRLSVILGLSMNTKSKRWKDYLYKKLGLPIQTKTTKESSESESTNYESLLKLQKIKPTAQVELAIQIAAVRTRLQMLEITTDSDGAIRCGYNIVGTESGRITCSTSATGSGCNFQTIPQGDSSLSPTHPLSKGMRDLYMARPGHKLYQADLSGADGWTVGAYLAMLHDPTMLEDLRAGLKPAQVICYMLRHGNQSLEGKSRPEIKTLLKEIKKEDWDYFACKQGIWGTCYTMGPDTLAKKIAAESAGKIWLTRKQVQAFQASIFARYKIKTWHTWMLNHLRQNRQTLEATNGFSRKFYGHPSQQLGQALAHLPQVYTTWATNLALYKLWADPANRTSSNQLLIKPRHQMHDSLLVESAEPVDFVVGKVREWFNNPVTIAKTTLVIPFSGQYGSNWSFEEGNGLEGEFN